MELSEYLKNELNIDEEYAKLISEKVKEFHHQFGHHHKERQGTEPQNIASMIVEQNEVYKINKVNIKNYHCNGCDNQCSLDDPKCGRGRKLIWISILKPQ